MLRYLIPVEMCYDDIFFIRRYVDERRVWVKTEFFLIFSIQANFTDRGGTVYPDCQIHVDWFQSHNTVIFAGAENHASITDQMCIVPQKEGGTSMKTHIARSRLSTPQQCESSLGID